MDVFILNWNGGDLIKTLKKELKIVDYEDEDFTHKLETIPKPLTKQPEKLKQL